MTTNDGNSTMDSSTLQSDSPSIDEKARNEAGESLPHDSRSPSPASASKNEGNGNPELTPVTSAKEADAGASNNDGSDDVSANYPTGLRLALITIALCLSVFLMALDNSIIATAIPKITDQFNSLPDVGVSFHCIRITSDCLTSHSGMEVRISSPLRHASCCTGNSIRSFR